MQLISEVDSLESKTQITRTLNVVIEANAARVCEMMSQMHNVIHQHVSDNPIHEHHNGFCAHTL
jgi:hypothetical protein